VKLAGPGTPWCVSPVWNVHADLASRRETLSEKMQITRGVIINIFAIAWPTNLHCIPETVFSPKKGR